MIWSWLLTIVGGLGFWMVGRKMPSGFLVCILSELLWCIYALETDQYGFILGALVYQWVAWMAWWDWRDDVHAASL